MNSYRIREKSEFGTSARYWPDLPEIPFARVMNQHFVFGVSLLPVTSGCQSGNDVELTMIFIIVMIIKAK